jgi:putative tricarboxylic transport membrane protein
MILLGSSGLFLKKLRKFEYEGAPLVLAFVLGPLLEMNLRKSLILSQGSFSIFITRPLAACALIVALVLIFTPLIPALSKKREAIAKEEAN